MSDDDAGAAGAAESASGEFAFPPTVGCDPPSSSDIASQQGRRIDVSRIVPTGMRARTSLSARSIIGHLRESQIGDPEPPALFQRARKTCKAEQNL